MLGDVIKIKEFEASIEQYIKEDDRRHSEIWKNLRGGGTKEANS